MCMLTINIVIHPALRNNMGDTKRAKISNSNKNFRTFKCKILISIIWLFQFDSFLAVVFFFSPQRFGLCLVFIYLCVFLLFLFIRFWTHPKWQTSNSLWNINVFRIFKLPTSRYVKKKYTWTPRTWFMTIKLHETNKNKLHRQNIKYYVIRNPLLAMLNDEILVKEIIFYTLYNLDLIYH